jgi:GDSL-like Lipase/Acylhydrolase family
MGMKAQSRSVALGVNLLLAALAILLTFGLLEVFVRSFVTVRDVGPAFTAYDPVYGKRLKANLHATRIAPEFRFEINTNSLGMRDPEPTKPLTDGIVFVGDSFTMGYGVKDNEAFPALVRAGLENRGVTRPVLNTGMGDNGNGRWVKFFDNDAARFRPGIVVLQVMANDFDDNLAERLYELDASDRLHALPIGPPGLGRKVQALIEDVPGLSNSYLVGLASVAARSMTADRSDIPTGSEPDYDPASDALTFTLVRTAIEKARTTGADVIGLLVGLSGQRRAKMRAIFEERGLTCLDGPNQKDAPDLFFKVDGHWNAAGHRRAAALLLPEILRHLARPRHAAE